MSDKPLYQKTIDCPYCEHTEDANFSMDLDHLSEEILAGGNRSYKHSIIICIKCKRDFVARFEIDLHVKVTKIVGEDTE